MKPSRISLKSVRPPLPKVTVKPYQFPPLASIKAVDLPNNGFGINNYSICKTKYGHWPVYKKVQNTKVTTEIKRIRGDIEQFKNDLLQAHPELKPENVMVNKVAGYVNVKGDVVEDIKQIFTENIKTV